MHEFCGEYGSEINSFIPYIYYLKSTRQLRDKVCTYKGMRPYYYFLEDHEFQEKEPPRPFVKELFRTFLPVVLRDDVAIYRDSDKRNATPLFVPPPYAAHYRKKKIKTPKPICVIQNKYNSEWGGAAINYLSPEVIETIIKLLFPYYTLVYIRLDDFARSDYSTDTDEKHAYKMHEKKMLRTKYSDQVILFEDLLDSLKYDLNTLKCILLANSKVFISVVGGHIDFANYFPGTHIIYQRHLPELFGANFYRYQHDTLLPGNTDPVIITETYQQLIETCESIVKPLQK